MYSEDIDVQHRHTSRKRERPTLERGTWACIWRKRCNLYLIPNIVVLTQTSSISHATVSILCKPSTWKKIVMGVHLRYCITGLENVSMRSYTLCVEHGLYVGLCLNVLELLFGERILRQGNVGLHDRRTRTAQTLPFLIQML